MASESSSMPKAQRVDIQKTDDLLSKFYLAGFHKYEDFQPLSEGGTAVLQTCFDKNLQRRVVMKMLHPHLRKNDVAAVMKQLQDLSGSTEGGTPTDEFFALAHWLVRALTRIEPLQVEAELTGNLREMLRGLAQAEGGVSKEGRIDLDAALLVIEALEQRRSEAAPREPRTSG